ncbi:glycosyltransferase [Flavobacteriales bacterium]|nr:glycosyltransferase [Flavobacteriales bacterium]
MKILIIHNTYQHKGGEDMVMLLERSLLEKYGHELYDYFVSNDSIKGPYQMIKTFINITYSNHQKDKISECLQKINPDIVHVHNFFPLITPSVFDACIENEIPVVHTLHNYRLICPSALLMHNNKIYEKSILKNAFATVADKVYRDSYFGTYAVARMIEYHKRNKTWETKVSQFIALTDFAKSKFIETGFLDHTISVKPNFVDDYGADNKKEDYFLFIGRLSEEKGIDLLLNTFMHNGEPLQIIGNGPKEKRVINIASKYTNITYLGFQDKVFIMQKLKKARALIFPSICYETFGMAIIEAFSAATPVIGPNIGAPNEIINHKENGLIYEVGDMEDLNHKISLFNNEVSLQKKLSKGARSSYELKYTAEKNYNILMDIYKKVINEKA